MTRRIIAVTVALTLAPLMQVWADDPGSTGDIFVPPSRTVVTQEEPVSAVPPPFLSMQRTSVAAGIGISWGGGTITFDGRKYDFSAKGLSLGDIGLSSDVAVGEIQNLTDLADFEGHYLAVEAGAAAGVGASATTMRNENGVVISLTYSLRGGRLTLGPEGVRIALK